MRRLLFLTLLFAVLAAPTLVRAEGPSHLVTYGETLYSIARYYGVATQALADANGITTESWVYAGQWLVIPGYDYSAQAPVAVAPSGPGSSYTVRAGDTLSGLAKRFGVSIASIAESNNIPPNGFLYTGTDLFIPGLSAAANTESESNPSIAANPDTLSNARTEPKQEIANVPAKENGANSKETTGLASESTTYTVQPGDTLYGIALRFGVSAQSISAANNLSTLFVYSRQQLIIPASGSIKASAAEPASAPSVAAASASVSGNRVSVAGIPLYKQKQTLTCEQSAASMATRGELTEEEIVAAMPRSENPYEGIRGETNYPLIGGLTHYGSYAHALQKGLDVLGRKSTTYYGQPYDKFKESVMDSLRADRPVLWWTTWRESRQTPQQVTLSSGVKVSLTPYEHTVLIVAADASGVAYYDPYDGAERSTTWANFKRTSGYFNNMALVIY